MATLVHFALASNLATLTHVSYLTQAEASADLAGAGYQALDGVADALDARRQAILAAADVLAAGTVAVSLDTDATPDFEVAAVGSLAPPTRAGIWDKIKGSFFGFFTSDAMTGASARKDIEFLTQNYPPGRREELFRIVHQRAGSGVHVENP